MAVSIAGRKVSQRSRLAIDWWRRAAALAVALAVATPAFASLGGSVKSVERDRAQMSAQENVAHGPSYDIHEMRAPYGTVVDEYVSSGGTVFAVTWRGQFPPRMQQILGSYFQEYSDALAARQPQGYGHHPLNIQEPGLVVQTFGHMGAYYGRAYLPDKMPAGVEADQIR
ncbi:MAG: DUF2844 domain-containing protein [Acidobacteriaceae bacterium]|jgi:hypothetical protein